MEHLPIPSLKPNNLSPEKPRAVDKSPQAMHRHFVKRMNAALTHFSAIFSTVLCLTLGSGLIYGAATTNPSRFHVNLNEMDTSISLFILSLQTLNLRDDEPAVQPQSNWLFRHALGQAETDPVPNLNVLKIATRITGYLEE